MHQKISQQAISCSHTDKRKKHHSTLERGALDEKHANEEQDAIRMAERHTS